MKIKTTMSIFAKISCVIALTFLIVFDVAAVQSAVYRFHLAADEMWGTFIRLYAQIAQLRRGSPLEVSEQARSYEWAMDNLWMLWRVLYVVPVIMAIVESVRIIKHNSKIKLGIILLRLLAINIMLQTVLYHYVINFVADAFCGGSFCDMPTRRW